MRFVWLPSVSRAVTLSLPLRAAAQVQERTPLRCSRSLGSETGPLLGRLPEAWPWPNPLTSPEAPLLYLKMGMIITHKQLGEIKGDSPSKVSSRVSCIWKVQLMFITVIIHMVLWNKMLSALRELVT